MNTTKQEKTIKQLFIGECWEYLRNNFHKFNQSHQIKIALTLASKDIPQEVIGMNQQIIMMQEIKSEMDNLRFKFGANNTPENIGHTEQVTSADN